MKRGKHKVIQPCFFRIWCERMFILSGCAIILGLLGTGIAVHFYRNYVAKDYEMKCNAIVNRIENWHNDIYAMDNLRAGQMQELWRTAIHWVMDMQMGGSPEANGGCSIQLYRGDRQQAYAQKEEVSYIVLGRNNGEEKSRIYECPNEILKPVFTEYDQSLDLSSNRFGKKKGLQGYQSEIYIEDIYIKGGTYIPGKVELRKWNENGEEDYTVVKEYDFTPKDTSGYDYIKVEEEGYHLLGPLRFSGDEQDAVADQLLRNYTEHDIWAGEKIRIGEGLWDDDTQLSGKILGGTDYIMTQSRNIGGAIQAKIVIAAHYSLFSDYGKWIVLVYGLLVVVVVLSSLVSAYYTYMVRKSQYDMDVYRRETTNAMAHDLKTPLTAISGYAENLVNKVHTEKTEYYCKAILENAQYMNEMVGNILELARVETVPRILVKEEVSMYTVTKKCMEKYRGLLDEARLQMQIEGEAVIKADVEVMKQAMENLLSNAIKYAKEETVIQVQLTEHSMCISNVMAAGLDVSVEELVKPFVKGDNSRNGKRGSGMGLAIVKHIVEESGYHLLLRCEEDQFIAEIQFS